MMSQPPTAGVPVKLRRDLAMILAPNPSPMTHWGTNTYLLGEETLAVIDPGPAAQSHLRALLATISDRPVSHILITHSHLDHSPLARPLADATGAPIVAYGDSRTGQSAMMRHLAADGLVGGGEGVDHEFAPDITLVDGEVLSGPWGHVTATHTPGHMGNHMCFRWRDALFCGDHVMGWASSLVSPPDGDLTDFMASCEKLLMDDATVYFPAHGSPIDDPKARLNWLMAHRRSREAGILAALDAGPASPRQLARQIYQETPQALLEAAARNVFAHLIDLSQRNMVRALGPISAIVQFEKFM